MDTAPHSSSGVVLVHGHRPMLGSMVGLARALRRAGYRTLIVKYPSRSTDLIGIADALSPTVVAFAREIDGPMHFVGHSLGGLVTRALLARHPIANLGRVVMLSPPHRGSEWADLVMRIGAERFILGPVGAHLATRRSANDEASLGSVAYPLGIIAGDTPLRAIVPRFLPRPNDGTVSVASTRTQGMTDHMVLPVTHAMMTFNRAVVRQTLSFLRAGTFDRSGRLDVRAPEFKRDELGGTRVRGGSH